MSSEAKLLAAHILTDAAINHILNGEGAPDYNGGHRFTSIVFGKTVFPEWWTDEDIVAALTVAIEHPARVRIFKHSILCFALVDEAIVEVQIDLTRAGARFHHGFPKNGRGVERNDPRGRTSLPLDLTELEK